MHLCSQEQFHASLKNFRLKLSCNIAQRKQSFNALQLPLIFVCESANCSAQKFYYRERKFQISNLKSKGKKWKYSKLYRAIFKSPQLIKNKYFFFILYAIYCILSTFGIKKPKLLSFSLPYF